jgi:hypothetical protein
LFGSRNIKVFCKLCEKFKWLAEKNVVREGGLWAFKYGCQKIKHVNKTVHERLQTKWLVGQ